MSFSFRRPQLAKQFCDSLSGNSILDSRSGLFLAARRRVGKTTFLQEDLLPEIKSRGWLPIYVDLWANKKEDPAILLGVAIANALEKFDGFVLRAAKAMHLTKVSVTGALSADIDKSGLPAGVSLVDALQELHQKSRQQIVLIIDEAQHALSSEQGTSAMFGLKSARDQMNTSGGPPALMLVMTGSNRDKLSHLVLNKSQPFYGSSVTPFPLLGNDFTAAYTDHINQFLSDDNQLVPDDVFSAFDFVGRRPQALTEIIGKLALDGESKQLSALLLDKSKINQEKIWADYKSAYTSLPDLQKAIIVVMVEQGDKYVPFSEDSMRRYQEAIDAEEAVQPSAAQYALDALREKELVWRESRGAYALEDEGFAEWFASEEKNEKKVANGAVGFPEISYPESLPGM